MESNIRNLGELVFEKGGLITKVPARIIYDGEDLVLEIDGVRTHYCEESGGNLRVIGPYIGGEK